MGMWTCYWPEANQSTLHPVIYYWETRPQWPGWHGLSNTTHQAGKGYLVRLRKLFFSGLRSSWAPASILSLWQSFTFLSYHLQAFSKGVKRFGSGLGQQHPCPADCFWVCLLTCWHQCCRTLLAVTCWNSTSGTNWLSRCACHCSLRWGWVSLREGLWCVCGGGGSNWLSSRAQSWPWLPMFSFWPGWASHSATQPAQRVMGSAVMHIPGWFPKVGLCT